MRSKVLLAIAYAGLCAAQSTAGIRNLLQRRLPTHANSFSFSLDKDAPATNLINVTNAPNDHYTVSNGPHDTIAISGSSPIALASGLRWYLTNYLHVDIYWFIGSTLDLATSSSEGDGDEKQLPRVNATHHGSSIVPLRYHFNTVTFSYTSAFWTWEDWELQLDWMALHGINLPLAWVGYEKILSEVLLHHGFSETGIASFLSGPAFQAWNRFGNIQGSWGGKLPSSWIDAQFALQKKIVARMVELGMTPALPCFTGFVPREIATLYPNASFVNGSQWSGFPSQYTNVTFLEPFDPLYTEMQKTFISKQKDAYGDVTNIYTLDQYNENDPYSGDLTYLRNVTRNTISALRGADPNAIWMLQGWLFFSSETFWTDDKVEAYLGGVNNSDMLIIDLFSETQPQWQRTNSYYGKPWLWCELHGYGGNMGLYGQIENVTYNPIEALSNKTSTMVGMGLTMEGQEGNEIIYDVLLDQAWSAEPINSEQYFHNWASTRYHASPHLPRGIYKAWDTMRRTVYNNTDLTLAQAETKSIFVLHPNTTGLLNVTGHHPTTITYDPADLVGAWRHFYNASKHQPRLWKDEAYRFDLTDITRQVMANAFNPLYSAFVAATANSSSSQHSSSSHSSQAETKAKAKKLGNDALRLLADLDDVLTASGEAHFSLPAWIQAARDWSDNDGSSGCGGSKKTRFYEYNAKNQVTLWGPTGEISDYASKQWAGLISSYYIPRWRMFFEYTANSSTSASGVNPALSAALLDFEEAWQTGCDQALQSYNNNNATQAPRELRRTIARVVEAWPDVFGQ